MHNAIWKSNEKICDSFLLWRVFWKLLKQENPLLVFLKVFLLVAAFVALVIFINLLGDNSGRVKKKNNKRLANRAGGRKHKRVDSLSAQKSKKN